MKQVSITLGDLQVWAHQAEDGQPRLQVSAALRPNGYNSQVQQAIEFTPETWRDLLKLADLIGDWAGDS